MNKKWVGRLCVAVDHRVAYRDHVSADRCVSIPKVIEFANSLRNGAILLNDYQGYDLSDPIALDKLREGFAKRADSISQTGAAMDQMAAGRHGSLGRVGHGLTVYTRVTS